MIVSNKSCYFSTEKKLSTSVPAGFKMKKVIVFSHLPDHICSLEVRRKFSKLSKVIFLLTFLLVIADTGVQFAKYVCFLFKS